MLKDLNKFGSQVVKGIKVESISKGYGEDVCHLIDELLNIELYRREYQFFEPVIPKDDGENNEESDNADGDDGQEFYGTQELNGIVIKTTGDQDNLIGGSDGKVIKRMVTEGKIEETKINFFDPAKYEEEEKMFERAEENQMIEANLDPIEWKQEVDSVARELREIEKDIELAKDRGGDMTIEMEEYRRHMDLIVE